MKTVRLIVYITAILLGFNSCDYLDVVPDNVATIDNAFSSRANAEKYLFTCYSYLPSYGDVYSNPAFLAGEEFWIYEEIFGHPEMSTPGAFRIARGTQNSNDPYIDYYEGRNGGKNLYKGIRVCNTFMNRVEEVADMTDIERAQWRAEAQFLRAYMHFWLLRMYGGIDIIDENLPVSVSPDDLNFERKPFDDCISFIVRELDEASEGLPLTIQNRIEELGRITKPIAKAVKARVLMTAASPQFNGNPVYSGFTNAKGVSLFKEYDENKWKLAAEACKEAIDIAEEAGHQFYKGDFAFSTYSDDSKEMLKIRGSVSDSWNQGIIWGATVGRGSSIQNYSQAYLDPITNKGGHINLFMAPTLRVAKQFYTNNGVPIEEDKGWQDKNLLALRKSVEADKFHIKEGETSAELHFDREPRFYGSLGFNRGIWLGQGRNTEEDAWYVQGYAKEASGYIGERSSVTGYYAKKLINPENTMGKTTYTRKDYAFPIIRLTDLYLYYAEALNEAFGPSEDVYSVLNKVRENASLRGVVESWHNHSIYPDKPSNKDGLREIIHRERLNELAFEGQRYWDLSRWLKLEDQMKEPIKGLNVKGTNAEEFYQEKILFNTAFTPKDYLWPVREYVLTINKNMNQTIGW